MKIFCIGAHKTGTTSMESALTTLGYTVCPALRWWTDARMQADFYEGSYSRVFELVEAYDAFQDSPFNHSAFYQVLHGAYTDARFVLTLRDPDHWMASRRRWRAALARTLFKDNKQLEEAGRLFFRHEYRQASYENSDERLEIEIYETRNRAILEFFQDTPDRLLVLDLEKEIAPWNALCGFLDLPRPGVEFPHANRTK